MDKTTEALRRHIEKVIQLSGYMIGAEFRDLRTEEIGKALERIAILGNELRTDGDIDYAAFVDAFRAGLLGLNPPTIDHEQNPLDLN